MTEEEYALKIAALRRAVAESEGRSKTHWERRLANALAPWGRNEETMFACADERENIWKQRFARGHWNPGEQERWNDLGDQIRAYDLAIQAEKARIEREQKDGTA